MTGSADCVQSGTLPVGPFGVNMHFSKLVGAEGWDLFVVGVPLGLYQ